MSIHETMARSHPSLERGQVWCRECGHTEKVDSADCLAGRVKDGLEAFRYQSSRPGVGFRDLPEHVQAALLPWLLTFIHCEKFGVEIKAARHLRTDTTVEALREIIKELADELEAELRGRYQHTMDHPAMKDRFDRDMETVISARDALATTDEA